MTKNLEKAVEVLTVIFLSFIALSVSVTQSAFFLAVILIIILHRDDVVKKISDVEINLPLLLFFLAAVVSLIFYVEPVNQAYGAKKLKLFILFSAYYFFIIHRPTRLKIKWYSYIITGALSVTLTYVIAQHYFGKEVLAFRYDTFQWDGGARLYPLFGQFSSIVLMLILPAVLFSEKLKVRSRACILLTLIPLVATLYLSASRTSIISVAAAILLMMMIKKKWLYLLAMVVALVAAGSYYSSSGGQNLIKSVTDYANPNNPRYASNMSRINMIKDTVDIVKEHPVTGIGYYGYKEYSKARGRDHAKIFNDYLNVLATMGLLGLVPFIWLIIKLLKLNMQSVKLLKIDKQMDDFYVYLSFGMFLSFVCFLFNAMIEPVFFNSETLMLMLFLLSMNRKLITEIKIEVKEPSLY